MSKSSILDLNKNIAKVRFATFFPPCENINLPKDAGMIPYVLYRDFGYDSYLICYRNGDYPYLKTEVPGLKLIFIEHINCLLKKYVFRSTFFNTIIDSIPLIVKLGRKINVLELYFFCYQSIIIATIYKLINKKGCVYLKLDYILEIANPQQYKGKRNIVKDLLSRTFLRYIFDIISVETRASYEAIRKYHPTLKWLSDRIYYLPNGIDVDRRSSLIRFYNKLCINKKENIILHIGRVGSYQKATDIVLNAFLKVAKDFPNWKLVLIGIMDNKFTNYFKEFLKNNENIQDRIFYLGFIKDRENVYEYYSKSKILAFPSRYETFSMVPIEAGYFGDVILGSDIPCVMESTNNGKLGYICPVDDIECFTNNLKYMLSHDDELKKKSESFRKFIIDNFNWTIICGFLNDIILKILNNK